MFLTTYKRELLAGTVGIEPTTTRLTVVRSTNWATNQYMNGGRSGNRTHGAFTPDSFQDCLTRQLYSLPYLKDTSIYRNRTYSTKFTYFIFNLIELLCVSLAVGAGIEPTLIESKSIVLPLDDPTIYNGIRTNLMYT